MMAASDDHPPDRVARKLFGGNLRRLRRERGLTQERLSGHSGLMQSYLSEVEAGKRNISLDAIATIARAMGVSIAQLFQEDEASTGRAVADEGEPYGGPRPSSGPRHVRQVGDDPG